MSLEAETSRKSGSRPLVIEESGPVPSNRALAPLQRFEAAPVPAAHEFAGDWELEDFLRNAGVAILDYEAVCRKMNRLARLQRMRWGWYRLRPQDCGTFADWLHARPGEFDRDIGGALTHGRIVNAVYPLAVPESAWALVDRIERGFGLRVNFYATHYQAREPDPFLAVTINGRELFVVAEWKRPGRREPLQRRSFWRLSRPFGLALWAWFALATALVVWGLHR